MNVAKTVKGATLYLDTAKGGTGGGGTSKSKDHGEDLCRGVDGLSWMSRKLMGLRSGVEKSGGKISRGRKNYDFYWALRGSTKSSPHGDTNEHKKALTQPGGPSPGQWLKMGKVASLLVVLIITVSESGCVDLQLPDAQVSEWVSCYFVQTSGG